MRRLGEAASCFRVLSRLSDHTHRHVTINRILFHFLLLFLMKYPLSSRAPARLHTHRAKEHENHFVSHTRSAFMINYLFYACVRRCCRYKNRFSESAVLLFCLEEDKKITSHYQMYFKSLDSSFIYTQSKIAVSMELIFLLMKEYSHRKHLAYKLQLYKAHL